MDKTSKSLSFLVLLILGLDDIHDVIHDLLQSHFNTFDKEQLLAGSILIILAVYSLIRKNKKH